jgi:hypothetical protein
MEVLQRIFVVGGGACDAVAAARRGGAPRECGAEECCFVRADVCATRQDQHDRFYADHSTVKEFEEEKHKKYEAETYFQVRARPLALPAGPPAPRARRRQSGPSGIRGGRGAACLARTC